MAQGFRFICTNCEHMIEAWDDGNPYYFEWVTTKAGLMKQKKKYAYHPSHEFERCVGNDGGLSSRRQSRTTRSLSVRAGEQSLNLCPH